MGCSISCKIWEEFATFPHWLTSFKSGLNTLDHYFDDYIFVGERDTGDCAKLMHCFKDLTSEIRVPVAEDKTAGPTTKLTYLGFEIDTLKMVIRIPQHKVDSLIQIVIF